MTTPYKGQSTWWTTIESFLTSDVVDEVALRRSINRLRDGSVWLRDQITLRTAALASVTAGSRARVIGGKDLSELVYDATAGDLNSKDLQIQTDNSGVKTVVFGMGPPPNAPPWTPGAPMSPGDVVAQILAETAGNPGAAVDAASHLNLTSQTTGGLGTITVIGGSALPLLGFAGGQSATGISVGADGASLVGLAPLPGWGGGTLRAAIMRLLSSPIGQVATPVAWNPVMLVNDASNFYVLPTPLAGGAVVSLLKTSISGGPPRDGTPMRVKRTSKGAFVYTIANEGGPAPIATMASATSCTIDLYWNPARQVAGVTTPGWSIALAGQGVTPGPDAD